MTVKIKNIKNKHDDNTYANYRFVKQDDISACCECGIKPSYIGYNKIKGKMSEHKVFTVCPNTKQEVVFFTKYKKTFCSSCINIKKAKIHKFEFNFSSLLKAIDSLLTFRKDRIFTNPNTIVMKDISIDAAYDFIMKYNGVKKIADYNDLKIKLNNKRNKVFIDNYKLNNKKPKCSICENEVCLVSIEKIIGDNNYHLNYYCKEEKYVPMNVDHIQPVSNRGSNNINNLQFTCLHCNLKKGDESYLQL